MNKKFLAISVLLTVFCGAVLYSKTSSSTTGTVEQSAEWKSVETEFKGTAYHATIQNPTTGAELSTYLVLPEGMERSPTVLFVPGATNSGTDYVKKNPMVDDLLERGIAVAYFDPDGRGESTGTENTNGYDQQDGLLAVSATLAEHPTVDSEQMGLVSFSFGVVMSSGMLARYADEQPFVWYLDWEGPVAREYVTVGCPETSPAQDGLGTDCEDDAFWSEREAVNFLSQITIPYQRIQGEADHVQAGNEHAIDAINSAVEGSSPWTRINDEAPNQSYTYDNPPAYIPGKKGSSIRAVADFIEELFEE